MGSGAIDRGKSPFLRAAGAREPSARSGPGAPAPPAPIWPGCKWNSLGSCLGRGSGRASRRVQARLHIPAVPKPFLWHVNS